MPNKVHKVVAGDTFELLSTRYYGEPSKAGKIRRSNPGITTVLVPGTLITILGATEPVTVGPEPRGLTAKIGGTTFRHISEMTITLSMDQMASVEMTVPLADTPEFREVIRPFSFQPFDVSDDGVRLFRGTLLHVSPTVSESGSSVKLKGYSTPGVLQDCTMPVSSYPLQFRNVNIVDIAAQVAEPFGVSVVSEGFVGGPFKRVKVKRDRKVLAFLINLAKQRQLLIRSNANGELVIAEPGPVFGPVASLRTDESPLESVNVDFRPQSYYSHVTGVRSTRRGHRGSQHTIVNDRATELGIVRPLTISMRDTSKGELARAAQAAAGRMLATSVAYTAQVTTWLDANGDHWAPEATVELTAPKAFVPEPYKFQIRSVQLTRTPEGSSATLSLMLPGAFGGTPPSMLPWQ